MRAKSEGIKMHELSTLLFSLVLKLSVVLVLGTGLGAATAFWVRRRFPKIPDEIAQFAGTMVFLVCGYAGMRIALFS